MEKKISMEEKKFKTLQDEFREINKQYQMNKGELVDQKEENSKLQGQIKLLREDVDHKIEEATGLFNIFICSPARGSKSGGTWIRQPHQTLALRYAKINIKLPCK